MSAVKASLEPSVVDYKEQRVWRGESERFDGRNFSSYIYAFFYVVSSRFIPPLQNLTTPLLTMKMIIGSA